MRILSRYLLKQLVPPFVFALTAITGFMLLQQVAKRFGDLVGKGLPWNVIVEVFVLSVPFILAMTLPMTVLVAVLFVFSRLAADNEVTAARAGGASLGHLVRPVLVAATGVAVFSFLFSDHVLPRTNHALRTLLMDIGRKKPTFSLKEQVINEVQRSRVFLRATRIDPATFALRDVTIYDLSDLDRKRIIYADSGYMAFSPDQEDLWLTLYSGEMHEFDRTDPKMFQRMAFRQDLVRVAGVGNELRRTLVDDYKGDREMGTCEMDAQIRSARREAAAAERGRTAAELNGLRSLVGLPAIPADTVVPMGGPNLYCRALIKVGDWILPKNLSAQARPQGPVRRLPPKLQGSEARPRRPVRTTPLDTLPEALMTRFNALARQTLVTGTQPNARLGDVRVLADRAHNADIRAAQYLVEVHKKYAIAAACIIFVLVAVPVALRFPRGGLGMVVGVSMGVFAIYYIGLIGGEALANRLYLPPALAMWCTDILFGVIGLVGLWRTSRVAVHARDGAGWRRLFRVRGAGAAS